MSVLSLLFGFIILVLAVVTFFAEAAVDIRGNQYPWLTGLVLVFGAAIVWWFA